MKSIRHTWNITVSLRSPPQGCERMNILCSTCFTEGVNWRNPEGALTGLSLSVTEALQVQQKLDETTKLLRDLQEAQKERLSAKQAPNMICLLAPTAKEVELGKSL